MARIGKGKECSLFAQLMLETFCHTGDERTFQEIMSELYEGKIKYLGGLSSAVLDTQKDNSALFNQSFLVQGND